jgi:hypothetical protein
MTALLAAVWLLLDYPWGLLAFVAIAALYGLRHGGAVRLLAPTQSLYLEHKDSCHLSELRIFGF